MHDLAALRGMEGYIYELHVLQASLFYSGTNYVTNDKINLKLSFCFKLILSY